jgi:hypothetical protein
MSGALAVDYDKGVSDAFASVASFVPKLALFLVILVVGILVAKVVQKVLTKVLQRVGFDDLVERGGVKKALSKSQYDAAGILAKVVYYFIFLGALAMAFGVFGADNPISMFINRIVAFLPNLFVAVIALVLAAAVAAAVKEIISNTLGGLSYGEALANAVSLFIVGLGVFFALDQLQIAPTIVSGLFYALLALVTIPLIIAFGVGGIDPARQAIVNAQSKAQQKAQEVKSEASSQKSQDDEAVYPATPARATKPRTKATPTGRRPA